MAGLIRGALILGTLLLFGLISSCDSGPVVTDQIRPTDVMGEVLTPEALPIRGALIQLSRDGAVIATTLTDEDGRFVFVDVVDTDLDMRVEVPMGFELISDPSLFIGNPADAPRLLFFARPIREVAEEIEPGDGRVELAIESGARVVVDRESLSESMRVRVRQLGRRTDDVAERLQVQVTRSVGVAGAHSEIEEGNETSRVTVFLPVPPSDRRRAIVKSMAQGGGGEPWTVYGIARDTVVVDSITGHQVEGVFRHVTLGASIEGEAGIAYSSALTGSHEIWVREVDDHCEPPTNRLEHVQGNGPLTVVLIHGWQTGETTCNEVDQRPYPFGWAPVIDYISEFWNRNDITLKVVRWATFQEMRSVADWLHTELGSLEAEHVLLVGHSMGGLLARHLAAKDPDKYLGIATLGTPHEGATAAVFRLNEAAFVSACLEMRNRTVFLSGLARITNSSGVLSCYLAWKASSQFTTNTLGAEQLTPGSVRNSVPRPRVGVRFSTLAGRLTSDYALGMRGAGSETSRIGYFVGFHMLGGEGGDPNDGIVSESSSIPHYSQLVGVIAPRNHSDVKEHPDIRGFLIREIEHALARIQAVPETGTLSVVLRGLTSGVNVRVQGPGGFDETATGSREFRDLVPGTYTVTGSEVTVGGARWYPLPATQSVTVVSNASVVAEVRYSRTTDGRPLAETGPASNVGERAARLNGTVNANGVSTQHRFRWGTSSTLSGSSTTPWQSSGSGTSMLSVNAELSGLDAGRTYYFRVEAQNGDGTAFGETRSFTTQETPALGMSLSPTSLSLPAGGSRTTTASITRPSGFTGSVTLTVMTPLPGGVTATITQPGTGSTGSVRFNLATNHEVFNNRQVTILASGSGVESVDRVVTLNRESLGSLGMSLSPTSLSLPAGGSRTTTASITRPSGFTGSVTLTVMTPLPGGVTATITQPGTGSSGSIRFNLATNHEVFSNVSVRIRASGSGVESVERFVTLNRETSGSISLSLSPTTVNLSPGGSRTVAATITRTGFSGTVNLNTLSQLPFGVSRTITSPGTGNSGDIRFSLGTNYAHFSNHEVRISASGVGIDSVQRSVFLNLSAQGQLTMSAEPLHPQVTYGQEMEEELAGGFADMRR